MYFSVLDSKIECLGLFTDKLYKNPPEKLTATWNYCPNLPLDVEYLYLYCGGNSLLEESDPGNREGFANQEKRLKAHLKSFQLSKIDLNQHCFYDLVPFNFIESYCNTKNQALSYIHSVKERPKNYEHLLKIHKLVREIEKRDIKLDVRVLYDKMENSRAKKIIQKYKSGHGRIYYNMFGSKTGRLTTTPESFPILTLNKEFRNVIKPKNDFFLELDFNACELRVLLGLLGLEQPKEDIHEWNAKNVFRGLVTRKEAKERIFAWLYNPESKDHLSNCAYDKTSIKEKYWDGKIVTTPFDRQIEADDFHALNYTIQSTASDMFLEQVYKLRNILQKRKSVISFVIHDSVVIDVAKEDLKSIALLKNEFENTRFGVFKVNVKAGKNLGEMTQRWI